MSQTGVHATLNALGAAYQELDACDLETLSSSELIAVLDALEELSCRLPTQWHRALARLQTETTPKDMGAKSWRDVLTVRWRISSASATRRLAEAQMLGPRRTLTGEPPFNPCCPRRLQRVRQRRRGLHVDKQGPDGMVAVKGLLTPEAWGNL